MSTDSLSQILKIFGMREHDPFTPKELWRRLYDHAKRPGGESEPATLENVSRFLDELYRTGKMIGWAKTMVTVDGPELYFPVPEIKFDHLGKPGRKGFGYKSNKDEVINGINLLNNTLNCIRREISEQSTKNNTKKKDASVSEFSPSVLAQSLRTARERLKVSQEALAERLKTRQGHISRLESGNEVISLNRLFRWAHELGFDVELRFISRKDRMMESFVVVGEERGT